MWLLVLLMVLVRRDPSMYFGPPMEFGASSSCFPVALIAQYVRPAIDDDLRGNTDIPMIRTSV